MEAGILGRRRQTMLVLAAAGSSEFAIRLFGAGRKWSRNRGHGGGGNERREGGKLTNEPRLRARRPHRNKL